MTTLNDETVDVLLVDGRMAHNKTADRGVGLGALPGRVVFKGEAQMLMMKLFLGGNL